MSEDLSTIAQVWEYLADDPVALAIVAAIVVPVFVAAWRAIVGTWPLVNAGYRLYQQRRHVAVIDNMNSPYFDEFIDLYHETFAEDERVSTEEVQCWLEGKQCSSGSSYRILVARSKGISEGFAICITNNPGDIVYVPYFGVSAASQKWKATRALAQKIYGSLEVKSSGWKTIAMEVLDPQESGIDTAERRHRIARMKRLHAIAKSVSTKMYRVGAVYIGPPFETDADRSPGRPVILFLMFRDHPEVQFLSKERLLEIVSFIYTGVYLPCYPGEEAERVIFSRWVERELSRQRRVLSPEIPLSLQV